MGWEPTRTHSCPPPRWQSVKSTCHRLCPSMQRGNEKDIFCADRLSFVLPGGIPRGPVGALPRFPLSQELNSIVAIPNNRVSTRRFVMLHLLPKRGGAALALFYGTSKTDSSRRIDYLENARGGSNLSEKSHRLHLASPPGVGSRSEAPSAGV